MDIAKFAEGLPETEKLYLQDSYMKECRARILRVARERKRDVYVAMDRTIFHPKAGGQPSDRGLLLDDGLRIGVKKVMERRGVLVHYGKLEEGTPELGMEVGCSLNWEPRYLVMRLHTAGHLLDHALKEVCGRIVDTLSASHGPPAFVEYEATAPGEEDLRKIEEIANEMATRAIPVGIKYVPSSALRQEAFNAPNLDRLPHLDTYRLVVIEGVNAIPCAGTHVTNTSELGTIKVLGAEQTEKGFKLLYSVE